MLKNFVILGLIIFFLISCASTGNKSQQQTPEKIAAQRRQDYINSHPELSYTIKKNILEGTIRIGMAKEQVWASWGNPHKTQRSGDVSGIYETWLYQYVPQVPASGALSPQQTLTLYKIALSNRKVTYLYFENGILTSFEEQN